jgi:hypothetical protein
MTHVKHLTRSTPSAANPPSSTGTSLIHFFSRLFAVAMGVQFSGSSVYEFEIKVIFRGADSRQNKFKSVTLTLKRDEHKDEHYIPK